MGGVKGIVKEDSFIVKLMIQLIEIVLSMT